MSDVYLQTSGIALFPWTLGDRVLCPHTRKKVVQCGKEKFLLIVWSREVVVFSFYKKTDLMWCACVVDVGKSNMCLAWPVVCCCEW